MIHDAGCEQNHRACRQCEPSMWHPHCHCASRKYPLCVGCRSGLHVNHATTEPSTGFVCSCDLCSTSEGEAA